MTNKEKLLIEIERRKERSAWAKGVKTYAIELISDAEESYIDDLFCVAGTVDYGKFSKYIHKVLLSGARNWHDYSWGGCSLIYDGDIAERLCNASELKRTKNGERQPNKAEQWLDTQARALFQAEAMIEDCLIHIF